VAESKTTAVTVKPRFRADHLSLPEAAHALGLTYQSLYRHILRGTIPGERRGKHWRVRRDVVAQLKAMREGDRDG
jgi:excisionase family DNA binding protein